MLDKKNDTDEKNISVQNVHPECPPEMSTQNYRPIEKEEDLAEVPIVDVCVAAGYGSFNSDHMEIQDTIKLSSNRLKKGTHIGVHVEGDSMWPTLIDNSIVIIRLLDRSEWQYIQDGKIYVVTTREGESYVKRIHNYLKRGVVKCTSDNNRYGGKYPDIKIWEQDIHNIWELAYYICDNPPSPSEIDQVRRWVLEDKIERLESAVSGLLDVHNK